MGVRKHRAPKGALRLTDRVGLTAVSGDVRKHRAPKGALRLSDDNDVGTVSHDKSESAERQKVH